MHLLLLEKKYELKYMSGFTYKWWFLKTWMLVKDDSHLLSDWELYSEGPWTRTLKFDLLGKENTEINAYLRPSPIQFSPRQINGFPVTIFNKTFRENAMFLHVSDVILGKKFVSAYQIEIEAKDSITVCFSKNTCRCFILRTALPRDARRLQYASVNRRCTSAFGGCWHGTLIGHDRKWSAITASNELDHDRSFSFHYVCRQLYEHLLDMFIYIYVYTISFWSLRCVRLYAQSQLFFRLSGCYHVQMGPVRRSQGFTFCRQASSWDERSLRIQMQMQMQSSDLTMCTLLWGVGFDQWQHYVRFTTSWH